MGKHSESRSYSKKGRSRKSKRTRRSRRSSKQSSKQSRNRFLKISSIRKKDKFCRDKGIFECNSKNTACKKSLFGNCKYDEKLEKLLISSIKHECDDGCKCMTENRPYTGVYRGRQFCSKVPSKIFGDLTNFLFFDPTNILRMYGGIPRLVRKIKDDIDESGQKKMLIKYGKILGIATISGIVLFAITSIVRNVCLLTSTSTLSSRRSVIGIENDSFFGFFTKFTKNVPKNFSTKINIAFQRCVREIKNSLRSDKILAPTLMGVLGAQEELIFRNVIPRFIERIKPSLFKLMKKFKFTEKSTQKNVHRIYLLISATISAVLFGLVHLGNRVEGFNPKPVYCQAIFTTVMGFILSYIKDNTNLSVVWLSHYIHNFVAMRIH
jgi:hypothetical protein